MSAQRHDPAVHADPDLVGLDARIPLQLRQHVALDLFVGPGIARHGSSDLADARRVRTTGAPGPRPVRGDARAARATAPAAHWVLDRRLARLPPAAAALVC